MCQLNACDTAAHDASDGTDPPPGADDAGATPDAGPTHDGGHDAGLVHDAGLAPDASEEEPAYPGTPSMVDLVALDDVRDMVHDATRQRLYIVGKRAGSESWEILRYDLANSKLLPSFALEGDFWGIDISPNEDHLVVADSFKTMDALHCHAINLVSGVQADAITRLEYPPELKEGGSFTPLFL